MTPGKKLCSPPSHTSDIYAKKCKQFLEISRFNVESFKEFLGEKLETIKNNETENSILSICKILLTSYNSSSHPTKTSIYTHLLPPEDLIPQIPTLTSFFQTSRPLSEQNSLHKNISEEPKDAFVKNTVENSFENSEFESCAEVNEDVNLAVSKILEYFCKNVDGQNIDLKSHVRDFEGALEAVNKVLKREKKETMNPKVQKDILKFILGLCANDAKLLYNVGNSLGMFKIEKILDFINILRRFQAILGVYAVPKISNQISSGKSDSSGGFKMRGAVKIIYENNLKPVSNGLEPGSNSSSEKNLSIADMTMNALGESITDMIYKDLFLMFDKDSSGTISFAEFKNMTRYMGLKLGKEKLLKLFSMADTNGNNLIDYDEFARAMMLIKLEMAMNSLEELGLTKEDLIYFGVISILYLIVALAFIFLGITAFSSADGFNAVINSLFPIAAGILAASQSMDISEKANGIKEYIAEFFEKMSSHDD